MVSSLRIFGCLLSCLYLPGCVGLKAQPLYPPMTPSLRLAMERAKPCKKPALPRFRDLANFKYGCFCSQGHPDYGDDITRYYELEPWDEIDRRCRDHDICWILSGKPSHNCNRDFASRMARLHHTYAMENDLYSRERTDDHGEERSSRHCMTLVADVTDAAWLFFPTVYEYWDDAIFDWILFRAVMYPVKFVFLTLVRPLTDYPSPGIKCNVATYDSYDEL